MESENYSAEIEQERAQFKELLLANPNYFGQMPESPFEEVSGAPGNTKYEELMCVGFNPNLDRLEATVHIKLPYGYGGDLCSSGTTEYVRFFLDYGGGWENAGIVAFNVHDIPDTTDCAGKPDKPLSYVVTLPIEPERRPCKEPVLPRVRAILSWEAEPPDDNPDWPIVWGNRIDREIQIKPYSWPYAYLLRAVAASGQVLQSPSWLEELKSKSIPQLVPSLKTTELAQLPLYQEENVEQHRFGFSDIQAATAGSINPQMIAEKITMWKELGLEWKEAVSKLQATSGDISYEELTCLGLDYNREWLVATFHIKRRCGYSGGLCDEGSLEYIAFWADWDDKCEWQYLDTKTVDVHDIEDISEKGLYYTAILKVNLDQHRRPCEAPKIARLRAVLSWNAPPSTTDPDELPHWGNRLDAHVQIKPGKPTKGPKISILGGIGVADINVFGDGMTKTNARFALTGTLADSSGRPCPFGGRVVVNGPLYLGNKYRVWVRRFGAIDETRLTHRIWTVDEDGVGTWQSPDAHGFFDYLPDSQNILNVLAYWDTSGDDLWEIRLEMTDGVGPSIYTPWYRIQLDHTPPRAEITIDGGECEQYTPDGPLTGDFVAQDPRFGRFVLDTLPDTVLGVPIPNPSTTTPSDTPTGSSPGDRWELNTSTMPPCGYVVQVRVWDRTIFDSSPHKHNYNDDEKGFCLVG